MMSNSFHGSDFDSEVQAAAERRRAATQSATDSAEVNRGQSHLEYSTLREAGVAAAGELRRRSVPTSPAEVTTSGGHYSRGVLGPRWVLENAYQPLITVRTVPEAWTVSLPGVVRYSEYGDYTESRLLTTDGQLGTVLPVVDPDTGLSKPHQQVGRKAWLEQIQFHELCHTLQPNNRWVISRNGGSGTLGDAREVLIASRQGVIEVITKYTPATS